MGAKYAVLVAKHCSGFLTFNKVTAQYIRFVVQSTHGNKPYAVCVELDVIP